MQLQFSGKNIEVTPSLKTFAEEKYNQHIAKRFQHITAVNFVLFVEHKEHIAEATLHYDGTEIHAQAQADDMYKAVDIVINKLLKQLTKHKELIIDSHR